MKVILKILFVFLFPFIASCGLFRTIGLYNVPPNYFETYQELTGRMFVPHSNSTDSLKLTLKSLKQEYSPYEEIKLELKVFNLSSDTIFIYEPALSATTFPYRKLIITDSLYKKVIVLDYTVWIDYVTIVDDYGRRINPTIAPDGFRISPKDSLIKMLSFRTGDRITKDLYGTFSFLRENKPGKYIAYYIQNHEEYDAIKGPIPTKIKSSEVEYRVINYTNDELTIRNEVKEIISAVNDNSDSLKAENLFSEFKNKNPDNVYIAQINEYLKSYFSLKNYKKKRNQHNLQFNRTPK